MQEKEIKKLKKKLEEERIKSQEHLKGWQRAKADYINREKGIEKEKESWIKFSNSKLILDLLNFLDSFNQCLKHIPKELKDKEKLLDLRLKTIEKQENSLTNQLEKLRDEILKANKK